MSETRVQFNTIVSNQLPAYVREDFPLISELLKQYYLGQEYQGGPVDLIQNIDRYIKLDNNTNLSESVILNGDLDFDATTINVDPGKSPTGTTGFPDSYGLLKINDEVITYTGKTDFSFTGCVRGFVGITSYRSELNKEEVVFSESDSDDHLDQAVITNLSCLFLKEFLTKAKYQFLPGLEGRNLKPELNQNLFVKQSKDFYRSKGTDFSFEILFRALYNEDVRIVKPRDFLISPSNAQYRIVNSLVVEPIEGDPENLINATLYQNEYKFGSGIKKAYAPITSVETIEVGYGKTFYKLSIDGGYNRDVIVDGAVYGEFTVEPSTRIIGRVSSGSTVLDVDSTVGFGSTGELYFRYPDNSVGVSSYTSKSLTQFYGVTDIDAEIADATVVGVNTFAYGRSTLDQDEVIEVRVNSVLNSFTIPSDTNNLLKGGKVNVTNLGISENNIKTSKWFYNVSPTYKVKSIELVDSSNNTYKITLNAPSQFRSGDSAEIILNNLRKETKIISVSSETSFNIRGQGVLDVDATYTIQRRIQKVSSGTYPSAQIYSTDIDNVYKNVSGDYLISSPSIPHYDSQPLNPASREFKFSGTFLGDEFEISPGVEHGFYTGDAIYYRAQTVDEISTNDAGQKVTKQVRDTALFDDGLYFVKRVTGTTVKFAKSRNDIFNSKFVSLDNSTTVANSVIKPFEFNGKTLEPQKVLRKISEPLNDGTLTKTEPGLTGMFVNGVELLNYKGKDIIKYGKIETIDVLSEGTNIDVINVPNLIISDVVGTGATGYAAVSGSLREVRIVDPGFDYLNTPTVRLDGGNGSGATAQVSMKKIDHEVEFFADLSSAGVTTGTSSSQSTIGFSTFHKFRNAEQVIYKTKNQSAVAGIVTDSAYFVSTVDNVTVRLHPTQADAIAGINTVFLTDHGVGKHSLKSVSKKSIVSSINVVDGGSGYENKKRTAPVTGINTSTNLITIVDHDYKTGEKIKYTCTGTPISGLSVDTEYYVTAVDKDSFHLSQIGISSDREFYTRTKQYINMTSVGVGTHVFNYPDISLTLSGNVGISSIGTETFKGSFQPIVRGTVTSLHLENGGVGYGSSEVLNLDRQPTVELQSGSDCQLVPIVVGGKIVDVIIQKSGSRYLSTPDLDVEGDGVGAVLVPVLENGSVTDVKIIEPGAGYSDDFGTTTISVIPAGSTEILPVFKANVQNWRVNLFEKYFTYFSQDDGIITTGLSSDDFGLQYSHLYAPRKLRETVFSTDQNGNTLYGERDLRKVNSIEVQSTRHSPILGFAYDGHPIYGPYAFSKINGGSIAQMRSGYSIDIKDNRPSTSIFPEGFFIEDYTHNKVSDDTVLDENNGRFCVTPEFPKGTYAYFTTINDKFAESSGIFEKNRKPVFPYVIGNNYKGVVDNFNFNPQSNYDAFDISNDWRRNTQPLNVIEDELEYPYFYIPNKLDQTATVTATSFGIVDSVGIVTGGSEYRINETLEFNNNGTQGQGVAAKVTRIKGRSVNSISVASSIIEGVEIYPGQSKGEYLVFSDNPHNFEPLDTISISGLSTTSSGIEGSYNVGIKTNRLTIAGVGTTGVAIGNTNVTGIVTYFRVSGDLNYPSIRENDTLIVGAEKVKVLNVDSLNSRIRILRAFDNTVGSTHTIGKFIYEVPRKLKINSGFKTDYSYSLNKQIYFDPAESVGLGTTAGVGIGTTISFSNPGAGLTSVFIQTKAIYLPGHNLKTGDQVTYSTGIGAVKGSGIIVQDETNVGVGTTLADGSSLFVAKINDDLIGIATVRVGLGTTGTFVGLENPVSTTLFFRNVGTGDTHSFKTNYSVITGDIRRNLVTVSTAGTHGLSSPHNIFVNVNPQNTGIVTLTYNDFNRRLIVNPVGFVTAGVNTTTNAITINSHGFNTGDKVIHTSELSSVGLTSDRVYYVVRVDDNVIKLSNTYFDSIQPKPTIVGITSASLGTINPITPSIKLYKNSTITFDLSDASLSYVKQGTTYPAFKFDLFVDKNFTKEWEKSEDSEKFELTRQGIVGSVGAKAELLINENTPNELYYNLTPIYESDLPVAKSEIVTDDEIISGNTIIPRNSLYNGTHTITVGTTTTFTYSIPETPEKSSYNTSSLITYDTDCTHTYGPISKVELTNQGRNYYSLPGITTVNTLAGNGAILETKSSSVGSLKNMTLDDIGFNLPSDPTLNPRILLPQIIKIDSLASFEIVGITSFGRGFSVPPKLIVLDGKTGKEVTDVNLKVTLGESNVEILKNTNGMNNVTPTIIPTQSGAGVGINTVVFNAADETVTATLSVGFSTVNIFPFAVGDKVLVEGISVGVGSTGTGYNSSGFDYKLFDVTGITENLGGIGSVTYSMAGLFSNGSFPGTFDSVNSSGKILASKHFPIFESLLTTRNFLDGETITSDSATGTVQSWDSKITTLTVSSDDNFVVGEVIKGSDSKVQGIASSITSFDSFINLGATSKVVQGWQEDFGRLNFELQKLQDNFYYQNFSYSLRSRVTYDDWNDSVSSLNHTLGYKKFSDYQLETNAGNSMIVGITTDVTNVSTVNNIDGFASINCVYGFDLATENSLTQGSKLISDEIVFSNRILTDYFESVGNRVLSIDDIGPQFNSNPRATPFSIVDTFLLSDVRFQKYITYVRDKRYNAQRQLMLVDLLHDNSRGYLNQYGRVETHYDQGSFDFAISGSEAQLQFYPTRSTVNDYDLSVFSYNLNDNFLGIGTTSLGGVATIETKSSPVTSGVTTTIVSIGDTHTSVKVLVDINPDLTKNEEFEAVELNIVHDGSNIEMMEYGRLTTNLGGVSATGLGTYHAYFSGSSLNVDFIPTSVGIATTGVINTIQVGLSTNTITGIGTIDLTRARLEARTTSISSSGSPGINTVAEYPNNYDAAYFIAQVIDTTNTSTQLSELIVVDDYVTSTESYQTYETEYGVVETGAGLGTFGSRVSAAGTVSLVFTPSASIDTVVNIYMNALTLNEDTSLSNVIDFTNGTINSDLGSYQGTESDIKRAFEIQHENLPVFERYFEGNDTGIANTTNNTIKIPNHFFVSGEKLKYVHVGETDSAIGIATTSFVGAANTTFLPGENLFAVKVDDNVIKIATSAENALKSIPEVVELESVGIGTSHRFVSTNQNAKVIVALDNLIQSPIVSTAVTTTLANQVLSVDNILQFSGITSFFGSDLIKIGDEIMKIEGVGIGSTNTIRVRREWLGTKIGTAATGDLVTKVVGNYNIVDNTLNFVEAPFGNTPIGSITNRPDERDWTGITTSSSFQGRSFMRSGIVDTANESYYKNYIFDDISAGFNATENEFTLKQNGSDVPGISTEGAVILVNDIFQSPGLADQYILSEQSGITSITFQGTETVPLGPDVGISSYPKGGIIVSVASTEGFGYQPLVAAGGTAIVSASGTITSIAIGNSGSGYRTGIQTTGTNVDKVTVNVAIRTDSTSEPNVVSIGTASVSGGHITGVAVTNSQVFYAPRDISNVGYSSITGLTTVTTSTAHGLTIDDEVIVSGIAFTCDYSGSGPVNVSNAVYDNISGIMTVTTSTAHNLSTTGQKSDVLLTGLGFTCGLDGGASTHTYPRTTDPVYCGTKVTAVNSSTEFEINAGVSTVPTFFQSGGTAQPVLIAPRATNNSASTFDPAVNGTKVLRVVDNTTFEINTGISTRKHFYARCGKLNKPLDVVFDNPLSYSNIQLVYSSSSVTGFGTHATANVVVGQGSSVIDFEIVNTGYGYGNGQILTVAIGGTTGIPTTSSYSGNEFQITIDEVHVDEFSGWTVGTLDVLDKVDDFIDGVRKDFPLTKAGSIVSIVAAKGSKINVEDVLLIFVNNILQVPGEGYTFTGGSTVVFTEAPKIGDTVNILFYKGSGDTDVIFRNVIETVKKGDTLQLKSDRSVGQASYLSEDERVVELVKSTNTVETNPYEGPGNVSNVTLERPVDWCRQTEDIFINQIGVGKDRELYEPVINPSAYLIKSVGVGSTAIYVDNLRPIFNSQNENDTDLTFQKKIKFIRQETKTGAAGTAVVSGFGTISSVTISDGGVGYTTATVSFGSTIGVGTTSRAFGNVTISAGGTVTGVAITSPGVGYTYTNPPTVLISPPTYSEEEVSVNSYSGDNGIIVGFGTTNVGVGTTSLIFDVHIPFDSFLRDTSIAGTAVTISSLNANDLFVVRNSNIGAGTTSITSFDPSGNTVGVGTSFADNVYAVRTAVSISTSVQGVTTHVRRVTVDVDQHITSGITTSDFFGNYSWGRIDITSRAESNSYNSYTLGGIGISEGTGISTSTLVTRSNFLKFKNYIV